MKVLIVDDEAAIVLALRPVLASLGHQVFEASDGKHALKAAKEHDLDLVLLDLGLPDTDGCDLIARLKTLADASIIVLSARHVGKDKIRALDEGADDYVDKPFSLDELLARMRVVERGRGDARSRSGSRLESETLSVDLSRREIILLGEKVKLSPKEFDLFAVMARQSGQVVTQRRLMIAGWNDPNVDGQYLRSYMALLREKLEADPSKPELILTEPGVGYRLNLDLVASD